MTAESLPRSSPAMDLDTYLSTMKLTEIEFAARCGVKQSHLNEIRRKVKRCGLATAAKIVIASARKVQLRDLPLVARDRAALGTIRKALRE